MSLEYKATKQKEDTMKTKIHARGTESKTIVVKSQINLLVRVNMLKKKNIPYNINFLFLRIGKGDMAYTPSSSVPADQKIGHKNYQGKSL